MENWIVPILFGPILGLVLALGLVCARLWISLRRQNLVVESITRSLASLEARISANEKKIKKEQDYQQKLALSLIEKNGLRKVFDEELAKTRKEFELKLKAAQVEAEEKIDFSVVQYKKSITKKRKIATRKAKPPSPSRQTWRSIDEE